MSGPAARLGEAVAHSAIGSAVRESTWLYPAVETVHIIGFVFLVGAIMVVDLRLLGLRRNVALAPFLRFALPISILALILVVPSGLLLFTAQAGDLIGNRAFLVKLVLLFVAAVNALAFHVGPYRAEIEAPLGTAPRTSTRLFAAASIVLWLSVIVAGRMIAYV